VSKEQIKASLYRTHQV